MFGWFATKTCRNTAVTKGSNDSCTQSSACCSKQVFFAFEKGSVMRLSVLTHDVQNNSKWPPSAPPPVHATSAHRGFFPLSPTSSLTHSCETEDEVAARVCVNNPRHLPNLQRKGGVLERLLHGPAAERPQVAPRFERSCTGERWCLQKCGVGRCGRGKQWFG